MTRISRSQKEEEPVPPAEQRPEPLVDCPRCAGNKRVLDFRGGDRTTGEPAGWKAVPCPGCGGIGTVNTKAAAAILAKMKQDHSP